ncbi:MAG: ATP-binding protein [Caldilineaceae bacterium]
MEKFLMLADIQYRQQLPGAAESLTVQQILSNAAASLAKDAEDAGLEIVFSTPDNTEKVNGDVRYLHRAVVHLLENSIQYRRPESKRVWLSVVHADNYLGLQVADESSGISDEMVQRLQRPFEQAERDERTLPGAGLSLALIQHVARLHGGYLDISSREGMGSTFTLWLPRPIADNEGDKTG